MVRKKSSPCPSNTMPTRSFDASKSQHTPTRTPYKAKQKTREMKIGNKAFKIKMSTLKSIRLLQSTTYLCIPKLPFSRLVREIMQEIAISRDFRVQISALEALQEASEMYLTTLFTDANLAAMHAKRITLLPTDMKLVIRVKN